MFSQIQLAKLFFTSVVVILTIGVAGCISTIPAKDIAEIPGGSTFDDKGDYIIGAVDILTINVMGQEELNGNYPVSPSGLVSFPLVGFVRAAGITTRRLAAFLQKKLKPYVKNPAVTLTVLERRSYEVFFSGEFNNPGRNIFAGETGLIQGIATVGGLGRFASGRIVIFRKNDAGVQGRYAIDYDKALHGDGEVEKKPLVLQRGDIVVAE